MKKGTGGERWEMQSLQGMGMGMQMQMQVWV
jgi:hypothetical protein